MPGISGNVDLDPFNGALSDLQSLPSSQQKLVWVEGWSVNPALVSVAKFSEAMLWVVGVLFIANLTAICITVFRNGKTDKDAESTGNENQPLAEDNLNTMGPRMVATSRYWGKRKVLFNRSSFISDEALVDGAATKNERLIVLGIRLFFLLFWLVFVFGGLSVLPTDPVPAVLLILIPSIWFFKAAAMMRKGRIDTLHKLAKRTAGARARQ